MPHFRFARVASLAASLGLAVGFAGPGALAEAVAPDTALRATSTGTSVARTNVTGAATRAATQAASHWRRRGYVAMGDSYSAGQGTFVYYPETNTTTPPPNLCHRSPLAYGPLLRNRERRLRPFRFVACSGALTRDLYAPNHDFAGEPAQLDALSARTRAVSLTIGGNDAGFATALGACVQTPQSQGFGCSRNAALTGVVDARIAALAGRATPGVVGITPIETILGDIARRSPKARIFLAGYPELFGSDSTDFTALGQAPSGSACVLNPVVGAVMDFADAQWINRSTRRLNAVFRRAVADARSDGVRATFVSPSTFDAHGLCDAKRSWIQPLLVNPATGVPLAESFHPTPAGQWRGYRRAFRRAGL